MRCLVLPFGLAFHETNELSVKGRSLVISYDVRLEDIMGFIKDKIQHNNSKKNNLGKG